MQSRFGRRSILVGMGLLCGWLLGPGLGQGESPNIRRIQAREFVTLAEKEAALQILDVRTPEEYAEGHMAGSVHFPVQKLKGESDLAQAMRTFDAHKDVYIVCRSGRRAMTAAERLVKSGRKNVVVVEGGLSAVQSIKPALVKP